MRQIANCPICGKIYLKNNFSMCTACYQLEEKNEMLVADYVREHPNCSVLQIHTETGVKESTILRMIKSGRLVDIGTVTYACESCGTAITTGRLCTKCNNAFLKEAYELKAKAKKNTDETEMKKGIGMYINYYHDKSTKKKD